MLLKEWKNWCQSKPLEALRALLLCFRSFAEVGGSFLKDFSPHQFTVGKNEVFLIDGPDALSGPLYDVFAARNLPTVYDGPVQKCSSEDKCPATSPAHCCCGGTSAKTRCEKGAKGAPEAAGGCAAGSCQRASAKTHVFDVAAKVWAFPYVLNFPSSSHPRGSWRCGGSRCGWSGPWWATGRTSRRRARRSTGSRSNALFLW